MLPICLSLLFLVFKLALGESDIDALLELKRVLDQVDNNSVKVLDSWNSNSLSPDGCPKDWLGITCNKGHITSITLNDLNLVGEFNFAAISRLQLLANLSISNNRLTGTISKEFDSITSLESLDLSLNLFNGSIPSVFASLKRLRSLNLRHNGFVGNVMGLIAQLGAVEYVDLSCNGFSGSLDLGIGNPDFISSIRYLNISYNELTGELFPHDGIPYFDSLDVFDASNNRLVGNVPSFTFVVSLRVIQLGNNQLSGSLPQGLLQESSMILSELDLSRNRLEGPVSSITSVNLRNLNLSSNQLSGPLPIRVGHCAIVDLSNNMFSGFLSRAQSWGNYVEVIELSSNELTGPFPNQTSQFLRLTSLHLSNNSIEGVLPPVLGTYPELQVIDFSLNRLTGSLLPNLFNSTKLTDINLSTNNISGVISIDPVNPQNYSLVSLNMSHNALTGQLPPELGRFKNLLYLDVSNNLLEGGIPDGLPGTLAEFNVSYNNLSGTVPQSLQRFPISSFHPGNFLLMLPNEGGSPKEGNNNDLNLGRAHSSRMKSGIRAAVIAGVVSTVSAVAVLTLVMYWRLHREQSDTLSGEAGGTKVVSSTGIDSGDQVRNVSSVQQSPKDRDHPELTGKGDVIMISSPMSTTSSVGNSPAKVRNQSDNPSKLTVCSPDKLAGDLHLFDNSLKFSPEELSAAPAEAIGMSCHGTLYKAVLSSGHVLAVKLLKEGIAKGRKEFSREAKKLGNIRHPSLVSIQGFYWGPKEHEKLVISKYIDAPCLALYLHGVDPGTLPPLSLADRLKIARDVACCLTYLHTESAIPHGNLKSTNILIEIPNINVLLTDYSLHRLLTASGTAEQVLNAGALGYLPPEFTSTSKPSPSLKSDVYAFGVILLELLTGRSSGDIVPGISPGNPDVVDLAEWVSLMAAENRTVECFDPQILGADGVDAMLGIALKCILPAAERPDVTMIFEELCAVVL